MIRVYLLNVLLVLCVGCQAQPQNPDQPENSTMDILFFRESLEEPTGLDVTPTEIRPAAEDISPPSPATSGEEVAYTHPYANGQRNGRVPVARPEGRWEGADTMALVDPARELLYLDGDVLVQQEKFWQFFDRNGTLLGQGSRAEGDITLDFENNRFYTNDDTGYIKAWEFSTADLLFNLFPNFGMGYDRSVLKTQGTHVWIAGTALRAMTHRQVDLPPLPTVLEVHTLGETLETDGDLLTSNRRLETLIARPEESAREELMLESSMIATTEEGLVMTTPDHIFRMDDSLQVTADLQGDFSPLDLSLDEAGLVYLVVRVPDEQDEESPVGGLDGQNDGPRALWGITPEGERFLNAPLPERAGEVAGPPLIGYDHTVYVLLGTRVVAVGPTGEVRWRHRVGAPIEGGIVTADNELIVTTGSRVTALTPEGERQFLWEAPDGPLRTSPVLVSPSRLYVASASTLYHLAPVE